MSPVKIDWRRGEKLEREAQITSRLGKRVPGEAQCRMWVPGIQYREHGDGHGSVGSGQALVAPSFFFDNEEMGREAAACRADRPV